MRIMRCQSAVRAGCGVLGIAAFVLAIGAFPRPQVTQAAGTHEITLTVDPTQSKVHYTVDSTLHTVHGTFELKKGSELHFDPESGKAGGEVIVDAKSGESGNNSRDERMHKEILETTKYPEAVFRPSQIEGTVALDGTSDVKLHGLMLLHGGEHEIVALVHAELVGDHWKGSAQFEVPYVQWGIKDPSNWLLKVKAIVNVQLDMAGAATGAK